MLDLARLSLADGYGTPGQDNEALGRTPEHVTEARLQATPASKDVTSSSSCCM